MGRSITVTIDSDDMIEMFIDRVNAMDHYFPFGAEDTWYQYYTEYVESGAVDGMKDFNVASIVDNDIINEFTTVSREDLKDEYDVDPDDDEAMEDFMDRRYVYTYDGDWYLVANR